VVVSLLNDNPKQQIIILAHNRNLIKYLHDAIQHRNIATVGYYVGGMKEVALKESETKQVIIATYSMASEGLDIKSLTTLIMATPKTDIQQSVGRILREKHGQPIVVDIIDSHEPFKNQWKKRRSFYMKEKYKITYTTSDKFHSFGESEWTTVFDINNPCSNKTKSKSKTLGKKKHNKSRSSTDRSITNDSDESENDSDEENEPIDIKSKNDFAPGKCLISIKK
jgi:superfamily II DNA or RNA helicase